MANEPGQADLVEVTPAMVKAGVEEFLELSGEVDAGYIVQSIYMAMEYERRDPSKDSLSVLHQLFEVGKR